MEDSEVLLNEILAQQIDEFEEAPYQPGVPTATPATSGDDKSTKADKETHTQWALGGNGRFSPVGATIQKLPAGIYEPFAIPGMWGLELTKVASDGIYILPDMSTEIVLDEAKKFWVSEDKYRAHNLLYKRGIILHGPPGGGKTVAVKILMNELVKKDGIVIVANTISLVILCLKAVRRIEPDRNLIVVFEDIDEIIAQNGEAGVLSMLDGENNVDNILHLATTNYPDRLGARIMNRPSRFDRKMYVGMPSDDARKVYLEQATNNGIDTIQLALWVKDTSGMSIAHLRELVAAVYCLGQPYEEVVSRLKDMATPSKADEGFKKTSFGFRSGNLAIGGLSAGFTTGA